MAALKVISQRTSFENKTVLLRVDTDIEVQGKKIADDTRLTSSLETINYLTKNGAQVILIGHRGRPDGVRKKELSLEPVAAWYADQYKGNIEKTTFGEFSGWNITKQLGLLENIRYFKNEEENDDYLARSLASLGNLFVNEAFAVAHRAHSSTERITHYLPSYAGLHFTMEIEELENAMKNPSRPLAVLIGGAKIETKLPMVEKMHYIADYVLVGGEIASQDKVLLEVQHKKMKDKKSILLVADFTDDHLDITPKSAENFVQVLQAAKTIIWNGPVGLTGKSAIHERGTQRIAQAIAQLKGVHTIVGGGDTLVYLREEGLLNKFSFVSTGGGAMLEVLAGKLLPGVKPLLKS